MIRFCLISRGDRIGISANSAALKARNGGFGPGAFLFLSRSANRLVSNTSSAFSICASSLPSDEGASFVGLSARELRRGLDMAQRKGRSKRLALTGRPFRDVATVYGDTTNNKAVNGETLVCKY